tara:strand:- start:301 stop:657 length:357 start_codon:yes stop_codon:yes gene_type:complete
MQKLTEIMGSYFKEERSLLFEAAEVPVSVSKSEWKVLIDPERLGRKFEFKSEDLLRFFVNEILAFQKEFGHHGKLTIEAKSVQVEVFTHNIEKVTGLDKEYADACDQIYIDVLDYRKQ